MDKEVEMNRLLRQHILPSGQMIQLIQGDLTQEHVDAIVNAANAYLQHGGGVARAIVQKGGPEIQAESDAWVRQHGPLRHDEPAYTGGGRLPCRYVIHAVGPVWGEGDEDAKLAAAVRGSLRLAERLQLTSLAFPAISTGIFGFPKERAARVMLETISQYFAQNPGGGLKQVRLTLYDAPTVQAFEKVWDEMGLGWQSDQTP
jgi:O-acetyl-ADP-ribose deacetylase (regulator of RNase III)